jgi:hypothetical protein
LSYGFRSKDAIFTAYAQKVGTLRFFFKRVCAIVRLIRSELGLGVDSKKVNRNDEKDLTSILDISMLQLIDDLSDSKGLVNQPKDFITVRLDEKLKAELVKAADIERRSLSNFSRLLLEYAWGEYLKEGSLHDLLSASAEAVKHRSTR